MMRKYTLGAVFFVLFIALSAVMLMAQTSTDDQGTPNDPKTNPRANVCYVGGSLAGKCDVDWKWVCGWGIARVEAGMIPRQVLSAACQSLMPALPPTFTPGPNVSNEGSSAIPTNTPFVKPK